MKEPKNKFIQIRCTEDERDQFRQATEKQKTTQSAALYKFVTSYIKRVMK